MVIRIYDTLDAYSICCQQYFIYTLPSDALNAKTTDFTQLTVTMDNVSKQKDILNELVEEYNNADVRKSKGFRNTIRFINERLDLVTNELSGVEGSLENYRGSNQAYRC